MEAHQANYQHVVEALTVMVTQGASQGQIKAANDFLAACEASPAFSTTLLAIYSAATAPHLQLSALLLLTNVLKRNWSHRRSPQGITPQGKAQLRKSIMEAYFLHGLRHYKHFNQLVGYLARVDYPQDYGELHQFILNSLTQLAHLLATDLEGVLKNAQVGVVLSTCKAALKEYNSKRLGHSEEKFVQFIAPLIQLSLPLSQQLFLKAISTGVPQLFEHLRKVDKVVLYALGTMPAAYQYKPETKAIVRTYAERMVEFSRILQELGEREGEARVQVEKYLVGVLEQVGRLQNYFPFLFSDFLRDYLLLLVDFLANKLPNPHFCRTDKLLTTMLVANFKPFTCFPYYQKPEEFLASAASRRTHDYDNTALQQQCHLAFREVYSPQLVPQLLEVLVAQVMTAPHVLQDHKSLSVETVLQDYEVIAADQPESSVYQHCITLLRTMIKCFHAECLPTLRAMVSKVQQLKLSTDSFSQQLMANILEVVMVLPPIYGEPELPVDEVCQVIKALYEVRQFSYLARIVRKYHSYLSPAIAREIFGLLARVVATPVTGDNTAEVIYQCALGLKSLMSTMEEGDLSIQVLASCISNIVGLVRMPEFAGSPTMLWPIINLLIRIVKGLNDISKEGVGQAICLIVQGLSETISSEKNDELIISAVSQLLATLLTCGFKAIKQQFPIRGRVLQLSQKIQRINRSSFVVFEACLVFIRCNIHSRAIQFYDTIHRLWLTLIRAYPTLYQQQLYGFQLEHLNNKLIELFRGQSQELMEEDYTVFVEMVEEYFITELIPLEQHQLEEIIRGARVDEEDERGWRLVMATASLYYSFSLLKHPVMEIFEMVFTELIRLKGKVSPHLNAFRTLLYLIVAQHSLTHSAGDLYPFFSKIVGNYSWLIPFLSFMTFVTNKFAFKLNAACLLKAISDIGPNSYSSLLTTSFKNQYPIDSFLKVVTLELGEINLEFMVNSYHNIYRNTLPNEIAVHADTNIFRKTKLHLSDPMLIRVAEINLTNDLRTNLGGVLKALDWTSEDLEERVGAKEALELCGQLGWERRIV